jgi:hypothetical protein
MKKRIEIHISIITTFDQGALLSMDRHSDRLSAQQGTCQLNKVRDVMIGKCIAFETYFDFNKKDKNLLNDLLSGILLRF